MAKVTEKQLKARVTELNLGILKSTTFGIKMERTGKGYSCSLVYRDQTPAEVLLEEGSAAEANACIEAVAVTHRIFTHSMMGSSEKPEFLTDELFMKKGANAAQEQNAVPATLWPAGWKNHRTDWSRLTDAVNVNWIIL